MLQPFYISALARYDLHEPISNHRLRTNIGETLALPSLQRENSYLHIQILTVSEAYSIIEYTEQCITPNNQRYTIASLDSEYEGAMDNRTGTIRHWASKNGATPMHLGISINPWKINQFSGLLGKVLLEARSQAPGQFDLAFLGYKNARTLLKVTNSSKNNTKNYRNMRTLPVAANDTWEIPWKTCFKYAIKTKWFKKATQKTIINTFLKEIANTCIIKHGIIYKGALAACLHIISLYGILFWRKAMRKTFANYKFNRPDFLNILRLLPKRSRKPIINTYINCERVAYRKSSSKYDPSNSSETI